MNESQFLFTKFNFRGSVRHESSKYLSGTRERGNERNKNEFMSRQKTKTYFYSFAYLLRLFYERMEQKRERQKTEME